MPIFFPQNQAGDAFKGHIKGRNSAWAYSNKGSKSRKNYAAFLAAPPVNSLVGTLPSFSIFQDLPRNRIPIECVTGQRTCDISASVWVLVDKIWGDQETTTLTLSLEIHSQFRPPVTVTEALDPFNLQDWQLATIRLSKYLLPEGLEKVRLSVKMSCNLGIVFLDDTYLSAEYSG